MNTTVIGIIVLIFISTLVGFYFSRSKKVEKPVKVMLFVLYFWGSFFIQLMVFAALYQLGMMDFLT